MICKHFIDNILKLVWTHFLYTLKEFQVLLFNTNNSIYHYSFICTVKLFHVLYY